MARSLVILLVAVAVCRIDIARGINCATDMLSALYRCLADSQLQVLQVPGFLRASPRAVVNAIKMAVLDPSRHCKSPEKYKGAVMCVLKVTDNCADPPEMADTLPDEQRVVTAMDLICHKYTGVDPNCKKKSLVSILECTEHGMEKLLVNTTDQTTIADAICLIEDITYQCNREMIQKSCDDFTAEVYLLLTKYYLRARVCLFPVRRNDSLVPRSSSSGSSCAGCQTWPLLIYFIFSLITSV